MCFSAYLCSAQSSDEYKYQGSNDRRISVGALVSRDVVFVLPPPSIDRSMVLPSVQLKKLQRPSLCPMISVVGPLFLRLLLYLTMPRAES